MMKQAVCWLLVWLKRWPENSGRYVSFMMGEGEPVRLIYANPTFTAWLRQNPVFNAHVHKYAALKNWIFPCQATKTVFCKFAQHQPSPPLRSGESKEGDFTTSS